ncbi:unnamed protein product [Bathycoccus prasinos]
MLFCVSSFAATTGVTSATTKTLSSRHRVATLISLQNGERSNNNRNRRGRRCFSVRNENDDSPKVYVPCGAFGGASSPERKAADVMHQLLTYTATWVVIGQLESINCRLSVMAPGGKRSEEQTGRSRRSEPSEQSARIFVGFSGEKPDSKPRRVDEQAFESRPEFGRAH